VNQLERLGQVRWRLVAARRDRFERPADLFMLWVLPATLATADDDKSAIEAIVS